MTTNDLRVISSHLDDLLQIGAIPDYPMSLNGVQLAHRGPVRGLAAAVDVSRRTIEGTIDAGANLLLVHHGMFWSGLQRLDGWYYERLRLLVDHDVAVYAAHLPLDVHATFGNSRLLARELGLACTGGFANYRGVQCGVRGESDVVTLDLHARLRAFSKSHGGDAIANTFDKGHRTRKWAICSGSGASRDTLQEALELGVDTLIVGEGPHWTAVEAQDLGLVVMYGGHYATETLGVCALAAHLHQTFGTPWTFIPAPTGL